MKKLIIFILLLALTAGLGYSTKKEHNFVLVKGGSFKNKHSNYYGKGVKLADFWLSKYEVTQKEWQEIMGTNPSYIKGNNLPVEGVSWYECIEYCNKRSIKEGLKPYYHINKNRKDANNKNNLDEIKWILTKFD